MGTRSQQIQVRVTPGQKAELRRLAKRANQDLSSYILSRSLPASGARFEKLVDNLRDDLNPRFGLAALNDFLSELLPAQTDDAVRFAELAGLSQFLQNYVAAMVEQACAQKRVTPPQWVREVPPLGEPYFAGDLKTLRQHLLRVAPVPFKRRNLFVDSSIGDRV